MDATDVWVANDEGTEIVRARDIMGVSLDYDGNVTVRLTGADGAVVTIAGHRTHHEEHRPDDLHRQLVRLPVLHRRRTVNGYKIKADAASSISRIIAANQFRCSSDTLD